jgi:hypothetical protein
LLKVISYWSSLKCNFSPRFIEVQLKFFFFIHCCDGCRKLCIHTSSYSISNTSYINWPQPFSFIPPSLASSTYFSLSKNWWIYLVKFPINHFNLHRQYCNVHLNIVRHYPSQHFKQLIV